MGERSRSRSRSHPGGFPGHDSQLPEMAEAEITTTISSFVPEPLACDRQQAPPASRARRFSLRSRIPDPLSQLYLRPAFEATRVPQRTRLSSPFDAKLIGRTALQRERTHHLEKRNRGMRQVGSLAVHQAEVTLDTQRFHRHL